jgi:hypothetical protein
MRAVEHKLRASGGHSNHLLALWSIASTLLLLQQGLTQRSLFSPWQTSCTRRFSAAGLRRAVQQEAVVPRRSAGGITLLTGPRR